MTISNRDVIALDRYANALEEFRKAAASNAGKMLRVERVALEKAAGGKKKLDLADEHLTKAERLAAEIVIDAQREVHALNTATRARSESMNSELAGRARKVAEREVSAGKRAENLSGLADRIADDELALKKRAGEANARDIEIDKRETVVNAREEAVTTREAENEARARRMTDAAA